MGAAWSVVISPNEDVGPRFEYAANSMSGKRPNIGAKKKKKKLASKARVSGNLYW